MKNIVQRTALYWAWLIVLIGFCISVFYAEILGHPPCPLCWYQRIALFPLVILLGIAAYRNDRRIVPYVLPIVGLGFFLALFHALQPIVPLFQKASICRLGVTCHHEGLGLFFPMASMVGFALIGVLLMVYYRAGK